MRTITTIILLAIYSLAFPQAGSTVYLDTIAELNDDYRSIEVVALYDNTTLVSKVYNRANKSSKDVDIFLNGNSIYTSINGMPLNSNQFDTTLVVDSGDTYKVRCLGGGESLAEITLSADLFTSIENQYLKELTLFPNPVNDFLTVSSNQAVKFNYTLNQLDGKQLLKGEFTENIQIDLKGISTGVYSFIVCKGGDCIERKILKH